MTTCKLGPDAADLANPLKKYYVTMIRCDRTARLAGPFDRHEDALAHVEPARQAAYDADSRSWFDLFGTAGIESANHRPGVLNVKLGINQPKEVEIDFPALA